MGTKTKDGPETLTMLYYSPKKESIILLFQRENAIYITVDFERTRAIIPNNQLQEYIIREQFQLIGAFYEN